MKTYSGFIDKQQMKVNELELQARGFQTQSDFDNLTIECDEPMVTKIDLGTLKTLKDHSCGVVESREVTPQGNTTHMIWIVDKTPQNEIALINQDLENSTPYMEESVLSNLWNTTPIRLIGADVQAFLRFSEMSKELNVYQKGNKFLINPPLNVELLQQDLIDHNLDVVLIRDWS